MSARGRSLPGSFEGQERERTGFENATVGGATVAGARARVLLAEDDPDMRTLIARALRMDGYAVLETGSGSELLQTLRGAVVDHFPAGGVDMVLCDLRMPGLSGLDVARMLRANAWRRPIVLMTALHAEDVAREARRLDVRVLQKPFALEELSAATRTALATGVTPT